MISKRMLIVVLSGFFLLAIAAVGGFWLAGNSTGPDPLDLVGGTKPSLELKLYGAARDAKTGKSVSGMSTGHDWRSKDGRSKLKSHNVYEDGSFEEIFYRIDESKEWSRDYYPLLADEDLATLRSIARFEVDGKTYRMHDVKRRDGTQERLGTLLADGSYRQTYFCKDGKTPSRVQLYDKSKRFLSETAVFCSNGRPIRELGEGEYGGKMLTLFHENGKASAKIKMYASEMGVDYHGEVFDQNGTLLFTYNDGSFGHNIKVIENGRVLREEQETSYMSFSREVTIYDAKKPEHKLFRQEWRAFEDYKPQNGIWLKSIKEFAPDGKTIKREFEFDAKTRKPVKVLVNEGETKFSYSLDEGGSIVKSEKTEKGKTSEISPSQNKTPASSFSVKPEWLKTYQFPKVPEWDDGNTSTSEKVYDFR